MKHIVLLLALLPFFTFCGQHKDGKTDNTKTDTLAETSAVQQNTIYYLIRHAEKDRTNPNDPDPNLTIDGMMRAKGWATYFERMRINEIYVTDFKRTKQTASMLSQ